MRCKQNAPIYRQFNLIDDTTEKRNKSVISLSHEYEHDLM